MQRVWLTKNKNSRLILFFGGWGLDERAVDHLEGDTDVLMFYDYRDIEQEECPVLEDYKEINVVAWSMGVWAASVLLSRWHLSIHKAIAINGTERPVDECYGIPPQVYILTEKGMDERGRNKFFARMLPGKEERERFERNKPTRDLTEQLEELQAIRKQSEMLKREITWNKVYISENDVIFPVLNQENWWRDRSEIEKIKGGHYPFYTFEHWELIV